MKQVLLLVLGSSIFWTACQKNLSDGHQGSETQTTPGAKGALIADTGSLRSVPTLIVTSNPAAIGARGKPSKGGGTGGGGTDTTTNITTPPSDTIITTPPPTTSIPASYSLQMPSIGYQGSEGSCVAWAVAYGARSYMQYRATGATAYDYSTNLFSPEYVFNQVKSSSDCSSSSMLASVKLLQAQGVCTWQSMPYSYLNGCSLMPTAAQTAEAASYKISSYVKLLPSDSATIKTMIAGNNPVPFTFNTDYTFDHATAGTIWTSYSGFTGAHAMVLCGYDDSKHAYKAMNCWGTSWGDAGYIWIAYSLLPVISYEAYVMYK